MSSSSLQQALAALEEHLLHLQEEGVRTIPVSQETLAALGAAKPATPPAGRSAPRQAARPPARPSAPPPSAAPAPPAAPASDADAERALADIASRVAACRKCVLCQGRTRTVPGQGASRPEILFVGEGPGEEEDRQGLAFVGAAGQLLTKMVEAMGCTRQGVFIANVVKCRPPGNRTPMPDEMTACLPYLVEQVAALKPRVIVALGATAAKGLLGTDVGIGRLRGHWTSFQGIALMPTYHPAFLLRTPTAKHAAWEDLKAVLARLGRRVPPVSAARP